MPDQKRSFIAVRFSDRVVLGLDRITQNMKAALGHRAKVKWVEPKNIHLTLQFLGDVDTKLLADLADGLSGAFGDIPSFEVTLRGVGAFPTALKPRVFWVGIQSGAHQLKALSTRVHQMTGPMGFEPEERPFRPHVTLGRVKDPRKSKHLSNWLEKTGDADAGTCQIDMVHLVASELKPTGPVYTILDSFGLAS